MTQWRVCVAPPCARFDNHSSYPAFMKTEIHSSVIRSWWTTFRIFMPDVIYTYTVGTININLRGAVCYVLYISRSLSSGSKTTLVCFLRLTVHLQLYLCNKPTRCTVLFSHYCVATPLHVSGPSSWGAVAYRGGWGFNPPAPRNSEVLPKLSRIPSSVQYTSVTT
jgi:hypothetical protein